jgi:sugar lactone lactonase YvrE
VRPAQNGDLGCEFAHDEDKNNFLNDLTINAQGDVFISDSAGPEIYVITRLKDELEVFLSDKQLQRPNGIDLSSDGKFLFVAVMGNVAVGSGVSYTFTPLPAISINV